MNSRFTKKVVFAGKSLLWSVMLYLVCMLAINWQDVTAAFRSHNNEMEVVRTAITLPGPAAANVSTCSPVPQTVITSHRGIITKVADVLVALGKVASFAGKY